MATPHRFRHLLAVIGLIFCQWSASGVAAASAPPQAPKVPVFVSHSGEDEVGVLYVGRVKDALKRSSSLTLSETADDADVALVLSTMNPDAAKPPVVTTAGWTATILKGAMKVYLSGGLRLCDRERLDKGAAELVASIEKLLDAHKVELPSSIEARRLETEWNDAVQRVAETLPEESCGVRTRTAFLEQMHTYLEWSTAANLKMNVQEVLKSVAENYTTDAEFAKKLQSQAAKLAQCQADLAALKKK
jgi:hypothetical protein